MLRRDDLTRRDIIVGVGAVLGVTALGSAPAVGVGSETGWFERPWFYPPELLFPVVWTLLFVLMGVAVAIVWLRGTDKRAVRVALSTFAAQFVLNLAWTPTFFGLQRPDLGLVVVGALWVAILATIAAFGRVSRLAAALLVPYLGWVSFAFVLNYAIYAAW
ncbi:TspO family protein [Natronomonas pharaonis DSM 2160]|uniref:TspO family protein n=1 Tax=Natronomonas pharaonis (strain ATCC 35678 / DSM 2160 / CIP 103997 / JCM 8858 / NBRC 14720 / NCIMB 2260 / Gabara) TaxID=348780 RepID=A0A1U7EYX8_NATPD|nr:TspO/MBR family protein [Natronomonas pharaonis]CAI50443.3 TspO family protein [Natronomonas pharaonis DSM 2160]